MDLRPIWIAAFISLIAVICIQKGINLHFSITTATGENAHSSQTANMPEPKTEEKGNSNETDFRSTAPGQIHLQSNTCINSAVTEAVRENIKLIEDDLIVVKSSLLDELQGFLSEEDINRMKSCSRRDQAHIFAEKLEECDGKRFLRILDVLRKTSFDHISKKLKESYEKYLPLQSFDSICSMCRIPAEVDIKTIRSGLISEGLLPHSLYKDINKATTTEGHQYALWRKLICHLKSLDPKDKIVRKFVKVFDIPQFESLHSFLLKNPLHNFDCTCNKRRKLQLNNRLGDRLSTSDSSDESNTCFEEYNQDPESFENAVNSNNIESEHRPRDFNTGTAISSESRNQDRIRTPVCMVSYTDSKRASMFGYLWEDTLTSLLDLCSKNQHKLQTVVSLVSNTAFERRLTDVWRTAFESLLDLCSRNQQKIQALVSLVSNSAFERRLTVDMENILTSLLDLRSRNHHKLQTLVSLVSNTASERLTDVWRNAFESLQDLYSSNQQEIQALVSLVSNTAFERRLKYRYEWEGIFTTLQELCLRNEHEIEEVVSLVSSSVFEREISMRPRRRFSSIGGGISYSYSSRQDPHRILVLDSMVNMATPEEEETVEDEREKVHRDIDMESYAELQEHIFRSLNFHCENCTSRQDPHGIQTFDSTVNITTPEEERRRKLRGRRCVGGRGLMRTIWNY